MAFLRDLPPEILELILLESDPIDIASFSKTCSAHYLYIYEPDNKLFWQRLYLRFPLDDLRKCIDPLGKPLQVQLSDWKTRLQRFIRARTIISDPTLCRVDERTNVLRTLLDLVRNVPTTTENDIDPALNHVWLAATLGSGSFFDTLDWPVLTQEQSQLLAALHTHFGLTAGDYTPVRKIRSHKTVYTLANYKEENDFGPYWDDGSGRVNWELLVCIHHVMAMHVAPPEASDLFTIFRMSLPFCQSVIPRGMDLDVEEDWAGVTGSWLCSFCFCDHRELLMFNTYNSPLFEDPNFMEIFRTIRVQFSVKSTERDPAHPLRPKINIEGKIQGEARMLGSIRVTLDGNIRWHFESGEPGNAVWSSEGVQIGGVRSSFGVIGVWTTVQHEAHDPVGPFWMRQIQEPIEGPDIF